jgi:acetyl-CoA/propionyl-CoA carboxylase biotin carboxyl carrier protein
MKRLLIANRAEIACRIMRTAREMGIETVAVYSDPDRRAAHVALADRAEALGGDTPASSYLDIARVVEAARRAGADAVHPGYGFLAENAAFAQAVEAAGLTFVGPSPDSISAMGDKIRARELAEKNGLPVIPSAPCDRDARAAASALGFPVLVKAAAGGGGRGMRLVRAAGELDEAIASARREAGAAFGDDRVYLEKYISEPRHVEIQVFGDGKGRAVHFGERECSVQRRHQKIIEESPSPFVTPELRDRMTAAAVRLTAAMRYRGAGTMEFVVDASRKFYFLEMNTRLQVEHPVTELVTSTDLVRLQIEVARGQPVPEHAPASRGHAVECRVYAEDPANAFLPTGGKVLRVEHPAGVGVRVDSSLFDGLEVPVEYDPLLAKIVAWGPDRAQAVARAARALEELAIVGVTTNVAFLIDVLRDDLFAAGGYTTTTVEERHGSWARERRAGFDLAAAAAALVAMRAPGAVRATGAAATRIAGPWETLGGWRAGTGRS